MTTLNGNIFRVTGLCEGISLVTGEFPSQRPVTRSLDVFFDLRLNKLLSKQSRRRWYETSWCSLWRHCYVPWPTQVAKVSVAITLTHVPSKYPDLSTKVTTICNRTSTVAAMDTDIYGFCYQAWPFSNMERERSVHTTTTTATTMRTTTADPSCLYRRTIDF